MEDGPPSSPAEAGDCSDRISRVPPYSISRVDRFRVRGYHPLWRAFPGASANERLVANASVHNLSKPIRLRASPLSLIATKGISVDFFSSGYLDISIPRVCLVHLCIQCTITNGLGWVSPFGNPRIKVCLPTPRGLSQVATSFIAFSCQGIHRMRLFA